MRCRHCAIEYEVWPGWCPNCGCYDWVSLKTTVGGGRADSVDVPRRQSRKGSGGGKKRVRSIGEDRVSTTVTRVSTTVDADGDVTVAPVGDGL